MNRWFATAAVLGAIVVLQVVAVVTATGHAILIESTPAAGSTVDAPPEAVVLTFNEIVGRPAALIVTGPTGDPVQDGDPEIVDDTMTQPITPGSGAGTYTVSFQATSADGHPISGTYGFLVTGTGSDAAAPVPAAALAAGDPDDGEVDGIAVAGLAGVLGLGLGLAVLGVRRVVVQLTAADGS